MFTCIVRPITLAVSIPLLLVACGEEEKGSDGFAPPASSTASSSPTSTPTPTSTDPLVAVDELVDSAQTTLRDLIRHPDKPLTPLKEVATGDALKSYEQLAEAGRKQGINTSGDLKYERLSVVELTNESPFGAGWIVTYCIDNSAIKLTKASDGSPMEYRGKYRRIISEYVVSDNLGNPRIAHVDQKGEPCAP